MRNVVIGLVIGLVVGVVLGVTILTPKIKTHAASKAVLSERDLDKDVSQAPIALTSLQKGDAIHWRSAPPFPSDRPNVANQARDFAKQLTILSGEKMILPVLPAKDVIAADRLFGAIASGRIDALFTTADIAIDKEPALALYSAIPFGPKPQDTLAWLQAGNGTKKLRDMFANHNIHALVCGYLPAESSGWFTNEINNAEQLSDLRLRITGLGAKVWEKAGANVATITPEEIMAAFDQDQIDGAVFSSPDMDAKSGFSRFAKNYYYPGWQNQGQPLLLLVNARAWKKLDQERKSLLKASCDQHTSLSHAKAAKAQFDGLSEIVKQEVKLQKLPLYVIEPLHESWKKVLAEEARRNQTFRETWEDLKSFLKTRRTWQEMSVIKQETADY
ncbi:putative Extracellular solute-binding protein, family 7 [Candidatus Terasakiella magnetica]|uniref:Putative Extracellular solute-binding protein, family 7 n=1 Tax=Candidatus Terasakiella magnetica TaxID=1867952 RepID=A0A1C3RHS2_9PROT|nr:hypothetical protein [Candidatus Terasakiella magnetica]SCA56826.1 putative Extracellular solute-binding protein, family 7 [Candidatus Terasakiella magnetica]